MDRDEPWIAAEPATMKYRPEIDGLRAIAVWSVVLYHADFSTAFGNPFKGGFLGVDIFFVISGYLISEIILRELGEGRFSFVRFYERRARRIMPALLMVISCSLIAGWFIMLPKAFAELGNSTLTALFFCANFYFAMQDSYTAEPSALKPLLHLWSLSVEEQFYVLFPPLLLLIWQRFRNALGPLMIGGFALSLILAQWTSRHHPDASFFLLPTRAWELLAGALMADAQLRFGRSNAGTTFYKLMPIAGMVCLIVPVFAFRDGMTHPGLVTLVPVVGAMVLIWFCNAGEIVTDTLSSPAMRSMGLVSYSFYLWHFPVFAFARLSSSSALTSVQKMILVLISLALAVACYLLIERPFRHARFVPVNFFIRALSGALLVILGGSFAVVVTKGVSARMPEILATAGPPPEWWQLKQNGEPCHRNEILVPCSFKFDRGPERWVLVGDSHAGVLASSFYQHLSKEPVESFSTFIWGGCPFILNVRQQNQATPSCQEANAKKFEFLASLKPSTVVISGRMGMWLEGSRFDNGEGGKEEGPVYHLVAISGTVEDNVSRTVQAVLDLGHRVILVYPIPEAGWNVPQVVLTEAKKKTLWELERWLKEGGLRTSMDLYFRRQKKSFAAYDKLPDQPNLLRIFPHKLFCDEVHRKCLTHNSRFFYYSDDSHLSHDGATLLVDEIMRNAAAKWPVPLALTRLQGQQSLQDQTSLRTSP